MVAESGRPAVLASGFVVTPMSLREGDDFGPLALEGTVDMMMMDSWEGR